MTCYGAAHVFSGQGTGTNPSAMIVNSRCDCGQMVRTMTTDQSSQIDDYAVNPFFVETKLGAELHELILIRNPDTMSSYAWFAMFQKHLAQVKRWAMGLSSSLIMESPHINVTLYLLDGIAIEMTGRLRQYEDSPLQQVSMMAQVSRVTRP